jgi:drug/metabolite transporter (DMT)-like permease
MVKVSSRTRAEVYLLSVTVVWGSTFFLTKIVLESASPFVYIALRFAIATILFGAIFFQRLRSLSRVAMIKGTVLGVLLFAGFVLQAIGMKYTTASKSAFITGMLVVFTPVVQLFVEHRLPNLGNILGVILVAIGLYCMTSPQGSSLNIGDGLTLICAVLFAVYIVYLDKYGKNHDPVHLSFLQFVSTAVLSILCLPLLEQPYFRFSMNFTWVLLYLAIFPTIIALYVQAKYQRDTTPTRSAVIFSMEPPIAAAFAVLFGHEQLAALALIGGALILGGLILSELSDIIFHTKPDVVDKDILL